MALVNQAVHAFKRHLPAASPVNLVTEKDTEGRVYISTYPTMMRLIDETRDGQRQFGVGHFDLVIIDDFIDMKPNQPQSILPYFYKDKPREQWPAGGIRMFPVLCPILRRGIDRASAPIA